jgi:acylpyruvate hydrolase
MKFVTIDNSARGAPGTVLKSGEILNIGKCAELGTLETWIPDSVRAILEGGTRGLAVVATLVKRIESSTDVERERLRQAGSLLAANTRLLTPITNPRLIVAAGLAFKSHLAEMAGTPTPLQPSAFMKSVNSVAGPNANIEIPPDAPEHVDYEGELAVVFGRTCHCVNPAEAMGYVAGYMAANDISARDWVKAVWAAKAPWEARFTWETNIMGKQYDGFTPMGPVLVTADEIEDVSALQITTRLNGKVMQQAPISDLIFTLSESIAHFSKWYTFHPGDILLTGTPAGVGVGRKPPVFMRSGDVIEVEISEIGVLRNQLI